MPKSFNLYNVHMLASKSAKKKKYQSALDENVLKAVDGKEMSYKEFGEDFKRKIAVDER